MAVLSIPPGLFATLVFFNAVAQSIAAAYLQTAFWAIGSLFGSDAIQALSVGGAAVGAVVGIVQVVGSYFSLLAHGTHKTGTAGGETAADNTDPARTSAIGLFTLTTIFLVVNVFIQWGLTGTKEYREFVLEVEDNVAMEEMQTLMDEQSSREEMQMPMAMGSKEGRKALTAREMLWVNKIYNAAIGYVFVVTTVRFPLLLSNTF
jgi:solute carrier family 29 (equilibrative nucleoside transporter), member 1/2/3